MPRSVLDLLSRLVFESSPTLPDYTFSQVITTSGTYKLYMYNSTGTQIKDSPFSFDVFAGAPNTAYTTRGTGRTAAPATTAVLESSRRRSRAGGSA